jgi:hypothetical protein
LANTVHKFNNLGTRIGDFLLRAAIPQSTIHCIGHSLGAHVCGYTGKKYKLARITGSFLSNKIIYIIFPNIF